MYKPAATCLAFLVFTFHVTIAEAQFQDYRVQEPTLAAPERGSVAGPLSGVAFGPGDLARGAFTLSSPFEAPSEEGAVGAPVFPSYSPDAGLSEWGLGFQTQLCVSRYRDLGDFDYSTDGRRGPWGAMSLGTDGAWYPRGMTPTVRIKETSTGIVAYLPDGSRWTFGDVSSALLEGSSGIHSWYLTRVDDHQGRRTSLTWRRNRSGRPYLTQVEYGGVDVTNPKSRIVIDYDEAPPIVDYRTGVRRQHDKRVRAVRTFSRHPSDGTWVPRWSYAISYTNAGAGAGYFLTQVQQVFASGQSAPAQRYSYATVEQQLAQVRPRAIPAQNELLRRFGAEILLDSVSTVFDANDDGLTDFELASDNTLILSKQGGYELQRLNTPVGPATHPLCRQAAGLGRAPRNLTRMLSESPNTDVVGFSYSVSSDRTTIAACNREGVLRSTAVLEGDWSPRPGLLLADVNRDQLPDLVRVDADQIVTRINTSSATDLRFRNGPSVARATNVLADRAWLNDCNGDGLSDVVTAAGAALAVHFGLGSGAYEAAATWFQFVDTQGLSLPELSDDEMRFFDANKDGLADALVTTSTSTALYLNDGRGYLRAQNVPALAAIAGDDSIHVDLEGTGNSEIFFAGAGQPRSIAVITASTSLMVKADDGKGTILELAYGRAPATEGVPHRDAVLVGVTSHLTGSDSVSYAYRYESARSHSKGRYLLGYGAVVRSGPLEETAVRFFHDDNHSGQLLASTSTDLMAPDVMQVEERSYETSNWNGVPYRRLKGVTKGFRDPNDITFQTLEYDLIEAYDGLCPSRRKAQNEHGVLTTSLRQMTAASFREHLTCWVDRVTLSGVHDDPTLDFDYSAEIERNAVGDVQELRVLGATGPLQMQSVQYDSYYRVISTTDPVQGTARVSYAQGSTQPEAITEPTGVVRTGARDVQGTITSLSADHGDGSIERSEFRYDGLDRLARVWNALGEASDTLPNTRFSYRYADGKKPAAVVLEQLLDVKSGQPQYARTVELATAAGKAMTKATEGPGGYTFSAVTRTRRSDRTSATLRRKPTVGDVLTLDVASLFSEVTELGQQQEGLLKTTEQWQRYHSDVVRHASTQLELTGQGLLERRSENDQRETLTLLDAGRKPRAFTDAEEQTWNYTYDALGRLRQVALPSGTVQSTQYDSYGRVSSMVRDEVGSIRLVYDAKGRLSRKEQWSRTEPAQLGQTVTFTYDAAGRTLIEQREDAQTGDVSQHYRYYDGNQPDGSRVPGQRGFMTGVAGPLYTKSFSYRPDGMPLSYRLTIDGFGSISQRYDYFADGTDRSTQTIVSDAQGTVRSNITEAIRRDRYGRVEGGDLQGQPFYVVGHDLEGRVDSVVMSTPYGNGERFTIGYDPFSGAQVASSATAAAYQFSVSTRKDDRGLPARESYRIGANAFDRSYAYSNSGYLASALDASGSATVRSYDYDYSVDGLIAQIDETVEGRSSTQTLPSGTTPAAGEHRYQFDEFGRVNARDDARFEYGGEGQITRVTRAGRTFEYFYDEAGKRLGRIEQGRVVAAFPEDGSYLDDTLALITPVRIAERVAGVLHHKTSRFEMLATDPRGTVLAGGDGVAHIGSPYGNRKTHANVSPALDYAGKGYDAELGVVRMGVRDYDPALGRFLTPDRTFLEDLSKCASSPIECNLYSYAKGSPAQYVDPDGRTSIPMAVEYFVEGSEAAPLFGPAFSTIARGVTVGRVMAGGFVGLLTVALMAEPRATPVRITVGAEAVSFACNDASGKSGQVEGHHTTPRALLTIMGTMGIITNAMANNLSQDNAPGVVKVDRAVHLSLHRLMSAVIMARHQIYMPVNRIPDRLDWTKYVDALKTKYGGDRTMVREAIMLDMVTTYETYDMYVIGKKSPCEGASDMTLPKFLEGWADVEAGAAAQESFSGSGQLPP